MKKKNRSDYIVLSLILLIIINMGLFAIKAKAYKDDSKLNTSLIFWDKLTNLLNFKDIKLPNILDIEDPNEPYDTLIEDIEIEDIINEDENLNRDEDIIIEKLEEYESLIIVKDSHGLSSIGNMPEILNLEKVKVDKEKPYIFIYHTHATEGYLPFDREDVYHTTDDGKNVVNMGNTMSKVLEANGKKVIHEQTHHDMPSYNKSYSRSLNSLNKAKEKEGNLKFYFDIHRDGVDKDADYYERFLEKSKITIEGKEVATFSLVIGQSTPNYDQVLSFAKYIKAVSDTLYPNLCTGIIIKPMTKFNLYISNYAALIELGSNLNTVDQANESAKLVGEILDLVINSIIE